MRSNGLTAPSYSPVADVDPQLADVLLGDLRRRGVSAYTKPVETSSTVGFDAAEFRIAVKERLYVDSAASGEVRELLARTNPASDLDNEDLAWARIVAGYDAPVASAAWPAQEDLGQPATSSAEAGAEQATRDGWESVRLSSGSVDPSDSSRSDEPFVPPEPPPLPRLSPAQQLAWLGLAGGPLLLLISALFAVTLPVWLSLAAVVGFVGGFLTLVASMEDHNGPDDASDNGAVV